MSVEVRLPQWGMGMHEGTVLRWFKREGDAVQADEELVEIEAEKTTQSVTAPMAGMLLRQLVAEGDTVPVRAALAVVGSPAEVGSLAPLLGWAPAVGAGGSTPDPRTAATVPAADTEREPPARRVQVTPVARKLARDLGVDLELVGGSGPGGRIDEQDVRAFHARPLAAPGEPVP
ncbi:MAG: E3 binding domain-containing protein, partial [Chloroflexi bacterium]|nr:E3 binding domain-containing protein [Chloroflexota bacterium]